MKICARLLDCFVLGHSVLKTKQLRLLIQSLWFGNLKGIGNKSPTVILPLKLTSEAQHAWRQRGALGGLSQFTGNFYVQLLSFCSSACSALQLTTTYYCWRMEDSLTASELAQLEYHTIGTVVCKINHCKEMLVLCSFFSLQYRVSHSKVSKVILLW